MTVRSTGLLVVAFGLVCGAASAQSPGATAEWDRIVELEASAGDFAAGVAAQRRGDLLAAQEAYSAAVEKDTGFVEALVNLARVQVALGEFEKAAATLDRAASQRSDYPGLRSARGLLALERGDAELAVDALVRARALTPDDVETLTNLGAALLARGLSESALTVLAEAQRLDPQRAVVTFNLALAHDLEGQTTRALHHYRRYLALSPRLDPDRAEVEARLAELTLAPGAESPVTRNPQSPTGVAAAVIGGTE